MEITPLFLKVILIIGILFTGLSIFIKNDKFLYIIVTLSCMFTGFIGFLNYASLSANYPNRRLLTLGVALLSFLPCILIFLQIKNTKVKSLIIKTSIIIILITNISLLMLFKIPTI